MEVNNSISDISDVIIRVEGKIEEAGDLQDPLNKVNEIPIQSQLLFKTGMDSKQPVLLH
jgi:hypothetical protein